MWINEFYDLEDGFEFNTNNCMNHKVNEFYDLDDNFEFNIAIYKIPNFIVYLDINFFANDVQNI